MIMRKFVAKHAALTTGTLSCFDRVLVKGHLPPGYPHAMEEFLCHRGALFKKLKGLRAFDTGCRHLAGGAKV